MVATLEQLHSDFLQECQYSAKLRPETLRGYKECFLLFSRVMSEIIYPKQLSPAVMAEFFKRLETRERVVGKGIIKKGIKNSTLATYRNKLSKFFQWLRDRKYLKDDPLFGVPYPNVVYSDRKFLYKEDAEKIFTALAFTINWSTAFIKRRNIAMYTVLLNCGIRSGELLGIKLLDIDFDHGELRVRAETSKSKKDRFIPMNTRVIAALKEYIQDRRQDGYTTPWLWVSGSGDRPFTKHGFKHLNSKVVKASRVRFHPHRFRHTFAVNVLNGGSDIYKLKQLMGHSDIRMTSAYLRCLPPKAMRQDVERLSLDNLL